MSDEWARTRVEADIAQFVTMVEDAPIEEVDEPTGRKEVEIAYEDGGQFHAESGEAYGVYKEDGVVKIDWTDSRGRTTVPLDAIIDLDEGSYYE